MVRINALHRAVEEFSGLSWLRIPAGSRLWARPAAIGCPVWLKAGHLAHLYLPV
jgi:hypothetical protein